MPTPTMVLRALASHPSQDISIKTRLLITCEHGGNRVPVRYRPWFANMEEALASHRGYDWGALTMARQFADAFGAPLVFAQVTRLLADLNRSPGHAHVFSEATADLPLEERARILQRYHLPYRSEVEDRVRQMILAGARVVHISSHSFTPELHGEVRTTELGLLYDPARAGEVKLARRWQQGLTQYGQWRVRRNYPYLGKNDGLTSTLRRRFASREYVGIELEVNQAIVAGPPSAWRKLRDALVATLRDSLQ